MKKLNIKNKQEDNRQLNNNNKFSKNLDENVSNIKKILSNSCDIEFRPLKITTALNIDAYIFFVNGLVDTGFVANNIVKPLIRFDFSKNDGSLIENIYNQLLPTGSVKIEKDLQILIMSLLCGSIGILIDNQITGISVKAEGWKERSIDDPAAETVVKGLRAGFVENIRVNTTLIRRMIKTPRLKIEELKVGNLTNTEINIVYIEGIVMEDLLNEVKQRITKIDVDGVITIGTIQEMTDDSVFSVFTQSFSTERPDRACGYLLEGKIVIIMDNSPFVMIVPSTIVQSLQSAEDYNTNYITASFSRILRLIGLTINLLLPGIYVSILGFHHEMIPSMLLKAISEAREKLPFPIFIEMLLLQVAFEILREAGVRLPRPVGQAVSIVGALVIGQAAVAAKLVSPPSIIIVALTAICSFTVPITEFSNTLRVLPFAVLFAGSILGMPGIIAVLLIIVVHLSRLRSFGVPYLSPIAPFSFSDWKDFLIRVPMPLMKKRPVQTGKKNIIRQVLYKWSGKKK